MSNEFDAREAADNCLRPSCRFNELSPGDKFRFPGMAATCVRTARGYRLSEGGRVFSTGRKTAVIKLSAEGYSP